MTFQISAALFYPVFTRYAAISWSADACLDETTPCESIDESRFIRRDVIAVTSVQTIKLASRDRRHCIACSRGNNEYDQRAVSGAVCQCIYCTASYPFASYWWQKRWTVSLALFIRSSIYCTAMLIRLPIGQKSLPFI